MDHHHHNFLFVLTLLLSCSNSESWTWFSSSSSSSSSSSQSTFEESPKTRDGSFSIEAFNDQKAIRLVENAKNGLAGKNPCWQSAYRRLFSGCSASLAVDEKRSRFAWHLSDCFQRDSGRPSFPVCDENSPMNKCLKSLGDHDHKVYLEFYLETNSICNQLQAHTFKHETERLVNELKNSAHNAEEKLEIIGERTESLLQSSNQIHDSLGSIDLRTQRAAENVVEVGERVETVLKRSGEVYEQALRIARSQGELEEGQAEMKKSLVEGLSTVQDSYGHLSREVGHLRSEAAEIEKEIGRVGDAVSSKMNHLQSKADEIGIVAGVSLDKQQQLLDGQTTAIKDVQFLTRFQSEALEESRSTLHKLVEYGHKQQEELFQRQTKLQELHDHLMDKSKSILEAQESFESKQATMFIALEKLFALQSAMVLESRLIKAFLIYSMMIFVIYMFTSTKQTYSIRPWLYIGLCATLCVEVAILRFTAFEIEQQSCAINVLRSSFAVLALLQIIHSIATYRDYEVLNYQMLQTLIEKVNFMERREMCIESDSEISWPSWIEHELPEDVNESTDPDYRIEQICENSMSTTSSSRRYNLRKRSRP